MVDLKKLIASFLILASVISSAAFLFSEISDKNQAAAKKNPSPKTAQTPSVLDVSRNAFVEQTPKNSLVIDNEPGLPPIIQSENLTQTIAQGLTREFFRANKNGPEQIGDQQKVLLPSDAQLDSALIGKLTSENIRSLVKAPNFDEAVPESDIRIIQDNGAEALTRYLSSVDKMLADEVLSPEIQRVFTSDPSFEAVSAAQYSYGNALYALKSMPVPSALTDLHKSIVQGISNRKKFADIPTSGGDDPLKTIALLEATTEKIEPILKRDSQNIISEYKKLDLQKISALYPLQRGGFFQNLFAPKAYAALAVPVTDYPAPNAIQTSASTYGNWLRRIWEWAQKVLLQQLKNQLIRAVEQQIVGWINGNGDPKFVTDWKGFLGDAFDKAAGTAINVIAPQLCSGLQLYIKAAFLPLPDLNSRYTCKLSQIVRNLENFSNNFSNGGFPAYFAAVQDNFFIYSLEVGDASLRAGIAAQQAKLNEAIAGGGFLSTAVCPNDPEAGTPTKPQGDGRCWDGSRPTITTPGKTVGDALTKSLELSPNLIINANDIAGLVAVVVDASINRLIREGLNGLRGVFTSSASSNQSFSASLCSHLTNGTPAWRNCVASANAAQAVSREDSVNPSPPGSTPDNTVIVIPDGASSTDLSAIYAVQCAPQSQNAVIQRATRTARATITIKKVGRITTGNGTYDWSASGGNPSSLIGSERTTFTVTYASSSAPGSPHLVTVTSGSASSTCEINVR